MYKISTVVSKQVVSLCGATVLGTVVDVLFHPSLKRAQSLLLMDCEENDEAYLVLPVQRVSALDGDAVVVKTLTAPLAATKEPSNNPVNLPCYNQDGKSLGVLVDVELDERFKTTAFVTNNHRYPADTLLSFSEKLAIFNDTGAPIKLPRPKARPPRQQDKDVKVQVNAQTAGIQSWQNAAQAYDGKAYAPDRNYNAGIALPKVISSPPPDLGAPDFSFLLHKRLARALYASDGRLIAPQDCVITEAVILDAGRENKLVQLALRAY